MKKRSDLEFAVIGIGAFGSALAKKLSEEGAYVIAIDNDIDHINDIKAFVSDTICFDATDPNLLKSHAVTDVDVAVISIGETFEPVAMIAIHLLNAGVNEVYGRASTEIQEQTLKQIGVTAVIRPEHQLAEHIGGSLMDRSITN